MPIVIVTSTEPGAGKTGVATAIARHYAYQGRPVLLARIASDLPDSRAALNAAYFGSLAFVSGSPAAAVTWADVADAAASLLVLEAELPLTGAPEGTAVVLVSRDSAPSSAPAGVTPAAIVVTDVDALRGTSSSAAEGAAPTILVGEDRTLAGFSMAEAQELLNAEVLVPGEPAEESSDYLVVAPIASDAGQPYFRRFPSKAVVVRFDKTDMHLAAMQADPSFLILTGGRRPNEYLFDAASARGMPVLLSRTDTENTVIALEGIYDRTRFQGERKLDRMAALLATTPLFEALAL